MNATECTENGLYYRQWSDVESPKAAIMLVHGLGEHCQRYEAIAAHLNNAGYSVYSMDLPNHGNSEGQKSHVDSFDKFSQAVSGLYLRVQQDLVNTPIFLLGHSMGGLISTRYLIDHQEKFSGAILSGPALESPEAPAGWQIAIMKFVSMFAPKLGMLELDSNLVSRDPAVVKDYVEDPLVSDKKMSAKLIVELFKTMDEANQGSHKIKLPMLIMHGAEDRLTSPKGSTQLHDAIASTDKTLKIYPELFHEIFNEPEAPSVYADVVAWLDARIA